MHPLYAEGYQNGLIEGKERAENRAKPLDALWGKVNALGGGALTEFDRGYVRAIDEVLDLIEAAGGKNPLAPVKGTDQETGE